LLLPIIMWLKLRCLSSFESDAPRRLRPQADTV
jgi:hypothetical protein